jgi:hypothetical protein
MSNGKPDLGETYPASDPSGHFGPPPASVKQARARVLYQMDHLEDSCNIGLDVGYAVRLLEDAIEDYWTIVIGA